VPPMATLPCAPDISQANGVTYYRCGQYYYMRAFSPAGPTYMPVQPPAK
jgi:Meckel syndrome type 1 protein